MPAINVRPATPISLSPSPPARLSTNRPQVTLKSGADKDQLDKAKSQVQEQGGKITNEFSLIKGFTYVVLPSISPLTSPIVSAVA